MINKQSSVNTFLLLDMHFSSLVNVSEDYGDPLGQPAIAWVVANSSYHCTNNGLSGVFDFIYNLAMLQFHIEEQKPPAGLAEQLTAIRDQGYNYILFNQGC